METSGSPQYRPHRLATWSRLTQGTILCSGDEVRAGASMVVLGFPDHPGQTPVDCRQIVFTNAALTIGPLTHRGLAQLDEGTCQVMTGRALPLRLQDADVTIQGGAELTLADGDLEPRSLVEVTYGEAIVEARAGRIRVAAGQRLELPLQPTAPPNLHPIQRSRGLWLELHARILKTRSLFQQSFGRSFTAADIDELVGTVPVKKTWDPVRNIPLSYDPDLDVLVGVVQDGVPTLRIASATPLWGHSELLQVRLRVRVSTPAAVRLRLGSHRREITGDSPILQPKQWTELIYYPRLLKAPDSKQVGLPTAAPIYSLTLNAVDAPTARLELYRVLVISPE